MADFSADRCPRPQREVQAIIGTLESIDVDAEVQAIEMRQVEVEMRRLGKWHLAGNIIGVFMILGVLYLLYWLATRML